MTSEIKLTSREAKVLGALFVEAAMFTSSDRMRPILTGVRFEEAGGFLSLIATDSYVLGTFTTRTKVPAGFLSLVDAVELAAIGKALIKVAQPSVYAQGEQPATVVLTFGEHDLVVTAPTWTLQAAVIPGDFPNYQQLMPVGSGTGDSWPALNTTYLALFGKLLLARPAPKRGRVVNFGLRFTCFGDLKPVRFEGTSDDCDFVGLLMPVRLK